MALNNNVEQHWNEMARKRETVAEVLSWSVSGRNLTRESERLSHSSVMKNLIKSLADENANSIDRFKMSQYLAQALEFEPEHNLQKFVAYLDVLTEKGSSQRRIGYYSRLKTAVMEFSSSKELRDYMTVYNEFKNDNTKEATLARNIMDEVSSTTQKILGEYM